MSATQDKNQKFTFVYSNLYRIHQKAKETGSKDESLKVDSPLPVGIPGPAHGQVLKTGDLNSSVAPRVESYVPAGLLAKRTQTREDVPSVTKPKGRRNEAIDSLKQNLKSLNDLHSRLKFMLEELEELVRE